MKVKTSSLTGAALQHAAMLALGFIYSNGMPEGEWAADDACKVARWRRSPIGKAWTCMRCYDEDPVDLEHVMEGYKITADMYDPTSEWRGISYNRAEDTLIECGGHTPREAVLRCLVTIRLGDEVEIPDDIFNKEYVK